MISYLQIEELTKSFGDLVLFENLSFGISEGDRIGLIAKNGTGKTTLLNIIAGKRRLRFREWYLPQGLAGRLSGTNAGISAGTNRHSSLLSFTKRNGSGHIAI